MKYKLKDGVDFKWVNEKSKMKYDDYTKCWLKYFKRMQELEKGDSDEI